MNDNVKYIYYKQSEKKMTVMESNRGPYKEEDYNAMKNGRTIFSVFFLKIQRGRRARQIFRELMRICLFHFFNVI